MRLAEGIDKKVGICDIETMRELFDVGCLDPDTGEWTEFEVSAFKNELFEFVRWYTGKPCDYLVTFNGINFDQQIMEWVVENHQKWVDLTGLEIASLITDRAQKVIEDSNFNIPQRYKERDFTIPPIDVYRIHHFDNDAKRTSLKWCAFMMNMDVEEMPIHHNKRELSQEEIRMTQSYRRNDCFVTYGVLLVTLGRVDEVEKINGGHKLPELKDYLGKNMIQDRIDVWKETGLWCMNFSDVRIGEEWNKLDYKEAEDIGDDEERVKLFGKVKHPYGQKFKNFFPTTMDFQTDLLKDFIKGVGNQYVKAEKQEFHVTIGSTRYTVAKGGLHSTERNRMVVPPEGYNYDDIDVGSQYPNSIVKLKIFAPHLKGTIMTQFEGKITKRLVYKAKAKKLKDEGKEEEARAYTSVQEMLKLCLNGGYYGKLGQKGSFLEYPEGLLKCCMSNQIEILMLIEMMELKGFKVLSGNTDGITVLYPEVRKQEFLDICDWWENKVGNIEMGKLEHTPFSKVWQENVNHYIAKKKDGKVKKKGRFSTEFLLHKNKSSRIIALAMEAYFIEGKDVTEFIKSHENIFDFCIAKKASGNLHYEEVMKGYKSPITLPQDPQDWNLPTVIHDRSQEQVRVHKKLIRYFVSKNGSVLFKRGLDFKGNPMNNHCEAPNELGQPLITYFNKAWVGNYDIDYDYYIYKTLERIDKIEKTNKAQKFLEKVNGTQQMTLF